MDHHSLVCTFSVHNTIMVDAGTSILCNACMFLGLSGLGGVLPVCIQ